MATQVKNDVPKSAAPNQPTGGTPRFNLESRFTRGQLITAGVVLLILIVLPFIYNKPNLKAWGMSAIFIEPPVLISQLADTAQYVILAIGLNIVVGYAGLLDLGYAAFFAFGAYTTAFFGSSHLKQLTFNQATQTSAVDIQMPFWVLILLAAGVSAFFGALLGAPTLRLRGDYLAIVTLGFGEIVPAVFLNLNSVPGLNGLSGGVDGINGIGRPVIPTFGLGSDMCRNLKMIPDRGGGGCLFGSPATTPEPYYYLAIAMVVIVVFLVVNLRSSRLGRAWMAIREDEIAAAAMGIDTVRTKLLAFASGAALAGVAGVMYATKLTVVGPNDFSFNVSVFILCMIILGGIGNIYGVIVGAVILNLTQTIFLVNLPVKLREFGESNHIDFIAKTDWSGLKFMIYGIILVVLMIVRPEGLIPSGRRKAELHGDVGSPEAAVAGLDRQRNDEAERANPVATAERESLYDIQEGRQSSDDERA